MITWQLFCRFQSIGGYMYIFAFFSPLNPFLLFIQQFLSMCTRILEALRVFRFPEIVYNSILMKLACKSVYVNTIAHKIEASIWWMCYRPLSKELYSFSKKLVNGFGVQKFFNHSLTINDKHFLFYLIKFFFLLTFIS